MVKQLGVQMPSCVLHVMVPLDLDLERAKDKNIPWLRWKNYEAKNEGQVVGTTTTS